MKNEVLESENSYFNEELFDLQENEDSFDPVVELRPKKSKIRYKFYIAS